VCWWIVEGGYGCSHVRRAEDCAVPVGHEKIIAFVQAVGARLCLGRMVVSGIVSLARLHCICTHACSQTVGLSVPAPRPFSPFSSSSSRRKLRGTFALMVVFRGV
jgi:hypothetical protein